MFSPPLNMPFHFDCRTSISFVVPANSMFTLCLHGCTSHPLELHLCWPRIHQPEEGGERGDHWLGKIRFRHLVSSAGCRMLHCHAVPSPSQTLPHLYMPTNLASIGGVSLPPTSLVNFAQPSLPSASPMASPQLTSPPDPYGRAELWQCSVPILTQIRFTSSGTGALMRCFITCICRPSQ